MKYKTREEFLVALGREKAKKSDKPITIFMGADLSGLDLSSLDLRRICFNGANFSRSRLANTKFSEADLSGANFYNADIYGTNFEGAIMIRASFDQTKFFSGANFTGAVLQKALFKCVDLSGANFTSADLSGVSFVDVIFGEEGNRPIFLKANLTHADLSLMDIRGVSLSGVDLRHADITKIAGSQPELLREKAESEEARRMVVFARANHGRLGAESPAIAVASDINIMKLIGIFVVNRVDNVSGSDEALSPVF